MARHADITRDRLLRSPRCRWPAALALALLLAASPAAGELLRVWVSPDVSVELGGIAGGPVHDEQVAIDDLGGAGVVGLESLGGLPAAADLSAFHVRADGQLLFSLDTTRALPNGLVVEPADVVRYDGAGWFLEFDGSAAGVANGARIDAVTETAGGLAVSFDTSVELAGVVFDDEDLVELASGALVFDGSAMGISQELDLDGAHALPGGDLVLSFDGSGSLAGVVFDDEDLLEIGPGSVSLVYDGSALHAGFSAGDLDAVRVLPEPGPVAGLLAGLTQLAALRRRSREPFESDGPVAEPFDACLRRTR